MQIRALSLVALVLSGLLAGCGFQLRGDAKIAAQFNPIFLDSSELDTRQQSQLTQALQRGGAQLTSDAGSARRLWVRLGRLKSEKIAGSGASDVEIRRVSLDLAFRLSDADGRTLLSDEIMRMDQLELDTNNVLAHERQIEQLREKLQRELFRVMLFQMTHFR